MSATEPSVDEEAAEVRTKVKATPGSQEVRHQLQKMVSGKLADRGISTRELWSTRPKNSAKLSKEEQERLERQRMNKRKWAQKERARSKAVLEELRQTNGVLEYKNQQLRQQVDKLRERHHQLRNVLTDHECRLSAHKTYIYMPLSQEWIHNTKDKDIAMDVEKPGFKRSFLQVSSSQVRPVLGSETKEEIVGQRSWGNFVPVTQSGFIVVDRFVVGQSTAGSQPAQHSKMFNLKPLHTVTSLTARPGMSTEVDKVTHQPEKGSDVKMETDDFMDTTKSEPSGEAGFDTSGQSLTSGGFTVSDLADKQKSFLQMLQDDDDVEMKEDLHAASVKREKQTEDDGQLIGDDEHPSVNRTFSNVTINGSEMGGLKFMTLPLLWKQDCSTPESRLEKKRQTSNSAGTSVVSMTAESYEKETLKHQPGNSERGHSVNQPKAMNARQVPGSRNVPDSPQTPHTTSHKPTKHMTRKGVLMERWFAQEHIKELKKKQRKSLIAHSSKKKASSWFAVNPWAVVNTLDQKETPITRSSVDSDSVVPDLMKTTVHINRDANSETSSGAVTYSITDANHPVISSTSSVSSPDLSISVLHGSSTESSTTMSVVPTTDIGDIQAIPDSLFVTSGSSSELCVQKAAVDDSSLPCLTDEGHVLTRRQSWPSEDTDPHRRPASRPRCLSLPSSFSDVVFEAADSDAQAFLTTEQLFSILLNPGESGMDCFPIFAVDSYPHTVASDSFSVMMPPPDGTDLASRNILANFGMEGMPSNPSTPPTNNPFGTRPATVSDGQETAGIRRKGTKSGKQGNQEAESAKRGSGHWEGEEAGDSEGRVKVERVPDADINTWQVLYEVPLPSEQIDISQWQTSSSL